MEPSSPRATASQYGSLDANNTLVSSKEILELPESSNRILSNVAPKPAVRQKTLQQQKQQQQLQQQVANSDQQIKSSAIQDSQASKSASNEQQKQQGNDEEKLQEEFSAINKSLMNQSELGKVVSVKDNSSSLPLPLPLTATTNEITNNNQQQQQEARPYPKQVLFIVANEFCERFSYYGLRTVLVLYLKNVLGFTDSSSTVSFHLFATLCYLTPILGAILGDSIWGKFKTILYLSIVYFIGELLLVISSIFWDFGAISILTTASGLLLIGIGTGGIKPCVSALGGDQFSPQEDKWRQGFFSLFYGAINLGSLISMFATPMLRSNFKCVQREDCYPYAFGLPCLLMFIAIVVFLLAKNQYNLVKLPEKNVIVSFCQCVWLALKRKLKGFNRQELKTYEQQIIGQTSSPSSSADNTSSSSLSVSSNEDEITKRTNFRYLKNDDNDEQSSLNKALANLKNSTNKSNITSNNHHHHVVKKQTNDNEHWLYLASDQFDKNSIEDYRSVLGILLLFVPLPVYWCLFDQQSSLWTLQATRMDGKVFGTSFTLQPDQMSVANPLLLLASIPVFEIFIYPSLNRCNLLTKPIQRITFGGCLAALTFVLSALIELRIQEFQPPMELKTGEANLILVNGLSECSIVKPMISYVQIPGKELAATNFTSDATAAAGVYSNQTIQNNLRSGQFLETIQPLSLQSINVISGVDANFLNNYRFKFSLTDNDYSGNSENQTSPNETTNNSNTTTTINNVGCPFDSRAQFEFTIGPLQDKSIRLLYVEQGNGKLLHKMFNESLQLPAPGKARVRLLYESFGSSYQAERRLFYLTRFDESLSSSSNGPRNNQTSSPKLQFKTLSRDGQLSLSDYLDFDVSANGEYFSLNSNDQNLKLTHQRKIFLKQGTRNLIIAHQKDSTNVLVNSKILQDNNYRISMLYQLFPYLLISISEVMFSITGLEFSYSMAPDNMKSIILGAWSLTTAFGNILTVAVESLHLFDNIAYDFLFYSTIMAVDMVIFAIIGYYYKPYKSKQDGGEASTNSKKL